MTVTKENNINAPKLWGIVNCTPDSFSDGGLFLDAKKAYAQIEKLIEEGADYIDIGAASSRPSSEFISAEEEWQRLEPLFDVIEENNKSLLSKISVDTWRADVAQKVLERNIFAINDISACMWEENLLEKLVEHKPYYVLMHCKGKPQDMQENTTYNNVVDAVCAFFENRLELLQKVNFPLEKVILDPGIGFGKNLEQNLDLMNSGERLSSFGIELMAGISRKSWIKQTLFSKNIIENKEESLNITDLDCATACASLLLFKKGFKHHRVHDIKKCKQFFMLEDKLRL